MSATEQAFAGKDSSFRTVAHVWKDFALPLAVVAGLVVLAITASVHFAVAALNAESAKREQQLVLNGLALRLEEVAELVVPQTQWDDAVRNLDNRFDRAWANANINEFLNHASGFDGEFVLDANDAPVYAALDGNEVATHMYDAIAPLVAELKRDIRTREAARGSIAKPSQPGLISRPIQSSALKVLGGQLTVVTATLVQPDFGTAMPSGPRAPIVVTLMHIDRPFLAQFSKRFLLENVAIRLPSEPRDMSKLEIATRDEKGRIQAYLTWVPLNPGYGILHSMALPLLLALAVLLTMAGFQLRRVFMAARSLIEHEQFSHALAYRDTLTGLANRNGLEEQLEWQLGSMQPGETTVGVTYIQLNQIDDIADRLGLSARDEFISIVANRLAKICRADTVLTRIGLGEFGVLSVTVTPQEASSIANRLGLALSEPVSLGREQIPIAAKVGSSMTQVPMPAEMLLREAHLAASKAEPRCEWDSQDSELPNAA